HAFREARFGILDVAADGVVDAAGRADAVAGGSVRLKFRAFMVQAGNAILHLVGDLEAVRPKELDAVVVEGVVRGGDHDGGVAAEAAHDVRDAGGGQRAHEYDV